LLHFLRRKPGLIASHTGVGSGTQNPEVAVNFFFLSEEVKNFVTPCAELETSAQIRNTAHAGELTLDFAHTCVEHSARNCFGCGCAQTP
jgi:hypothetical protein